jgi:hypothetical protein
MTRSKTTTKLFPDEFQSSLFGEADQDSSQQEADLLSAPMPDPTESGASAPTPEPVAASNAVAAAAFPMAAAEPAAEPADAIAAAPEAEPDESISPAAELEDLPKSPRIRQPKRRKSSPAAPAPAAPGMDKRRPLAATPARQEQHWLLQALELSRLRARAESGHWHEQLVQWSRERGHAVSTTKRNLQSAYDYGSIRAVLVAAGLAGDIPSFEELCRRCAEPGRPVGKRARLLDLGSLVGLAPAPTLHRLLKSWLKDELELQEIQALRQSIARAPSGELSNLKRRRGRNAGARAQVAWTEVDPGGSIVVKVTEAPELLGQATKPVGVWRKVRLDAPRQIPGNGLPASVAEPEQIVLLFHRSELATDIVQLMVVPEELRSLGGWVPDLGADRLWLVVGEAFDGSGLPSYCGLIRISRSGGLRFEVERGSTDLRPYPEKRNLLLSYCLLQQLDRQPLPA